MWRISVSRNNHKQFFMSIAIFSKTFLCQQQEFLSSTRSGSFNFSPFLLPFNGRFLQLKACMLMNDDQAVWSKNKCGFRVRSTGITRAWDLVILLEDIKIKAVYMVH